MCLATVVVSSLLILILSLIRLSDTLILISPPSTGSQKQYLLVYPCSCQALPIEISTLIRYTTKLVHFSLTVGMPLTNWQAFWLPKRWSIYDWPSLHQYLRNLWLCLESTSRINLSLSPVRQICGTGCQLGDQQSGPHCGEGREHREVCEDSLVSRQHHQKGRSNSSAPWRSRWKTRWGGPYYSSNSLSAP